MKNFTFKTRLVFTVLIFALAFAVPVSNTITEEVGITQTVNAKTKKKSKKPKKKGKVITVKKADKATAKKIYTEGMKGKTFTIQYKCKSSSKKNISKGKKQLVKMCKSLDNYFPQFNTLGVNFKVSSALNIYKGDIKQSGKYVFVVIYKGSENMDKFTCQRYALEVLPQLTSEWVQSKSAYHNSQERLDKIAKMEKFVKDYEAGLIKTKEDLEGEDYYYSDWGTLEESYNHTKDAIHEHYFNLAVVKAINEGKWINLDDPIRAYILSEASMKHAVYDYEKARTHGKSRDFSHSSLLAKLHSGQTVKVVCDEYLELHQTLWELTTFYNMDYNPWKETSTNHAWGKCRFKTNSGQVVQFRTDNGGCTIEPVGTEVGVGDYVYFELYELYPDPNNIYHN